MKIDPHKICISLRTLLKICLKNKGRQNKPHKMTYVTISPVTRHHVHQSQMQITEVDGSW